MSLDWALTAWGFDGEVSVEILLKDKDTWNFIEKDDSQLPQPTSCSDYDDAAVDAFEAIQSVKDFLAGTRNDFIEFDRSRFDGISFECPVVA